jgi:LytR cell envelope-related transcriptional attenuator
MSKSWPFALAVIVVGGLAGVAIAGRPETSDPFVLDSSNTVAIDSVPSSDDPVATTTTTQTTSTTVATTTTAPATPKPTTTSTAETSAPTSIAATTTTAQETTTTISGPLPRDQVELVIANGDGRFRLASITADRLAPLGYSIVLGDALQTVDATIIYYRTGFEDEAAIVANDILVPNAIIAAYPTDAPPAISNTDDRGNVIIVLGPDAPR